jgi:hypothetical protein
MKIFRNIILHVMFWRGGAILGDSDGVYGVYRVGILVIVGRDQRDFLHR